MPVTHRLPLLLIGLVILIGGWGRLERLGERELWTDELNQYFAARSIAEGAGPRLPSGEAYTRGLAISRAIAVAQRYVVDSELAVRLPSALFGVVNLVLMAIVAWVLAGPWAAFWATALLAFFPEAVDQSRTGRFYTYQLNFGLIALLGGWFATRPPRAEDANSLRPIATGWTWMAVTLAALLLGYRAQPTMLTVALAVATWIALVAADDVRREGRRAFRQSVPVQAVVVGVLAFVVLLATGSIQEQIAGWWSQAQWAATWVESKSSRFYLRLLSERVPWVMSILPLFALIALHQRPRVALYLFCWFLIPLALHSFLLTWKGERYFLLPIPALFIIAGLGVSFSLGVFSRASSAWLAERRVPWPRTINHAIVAAASAWALITLPGFLRTRNLVTDLPDTAPWRVAGEILSQTAGVEDIPWGSMDPLVSLHFWGRVDFGVQPGLLDYALDPVSRATALRFPPAGGAFPRDYYTGVPLTTSPAEIRTAFREYGAVIIGLFPEWRQFVDSTLAATLEQEGRDLCARRCADGLALYLWRFGPPPDPRGTDGGLSAVEQR
jgi:hypothetical protein